MALDPSPQQAEWRHVAPGIWRATIGTPERFTPVRCRSVAPAPALQSMPAGALPFGALQGDIDSRGTHITLPLHPDELVYGFGLQLLSYQQRGKKRTIRVNADPKVDSGDSHAPVPFYVTTRGYGILVDTFRHADFYVGDVSPRPSAPQRNQDAKVNLPDDVEVHDASKQAAVRVEAPRSAGVDVYCFSGPQMIDAVRRYNLFSGGGVEPPRWGLGVWYRAETHLHADAVLQLAHEFRNRNIPCDVLGLEPGWQTHSYSCSYKWEPTRYPEPGKFLQQCAALDYKVNLWEHAFTHPSSPLFVPLQPHAGDTAVWDGLVPDFAAEPARKIFSSYHAQELIGAGVASFKLDECDGSDFTGGWSFPDFAKFPSGLDGEQMHACFGLRYQDAIWSAFRQAKKPTYGLVRSSGALAAPYPFVLYSDLYDHRQFVRALVNSGFSGLLWTTEVRDAATEEDLFRRLQSVVFSPLAQVDAWYITNPPWKQINKEKNNRNQLAEGWESTEARCREILQWRIQMLPYLQSAFAKYAADGTPPFRALVLDFPNEPALSKVDDQYMMGDSLMIAPLFANEPGRDIVLPSGRWHDFWTGETHDGGTKLHVTSEYRQIPVYVRGDASIPWSAVARSTADPASRQIVMRMYGAARQEAHNSLSGYTIMEWKHVS
jgi:alpha-D-xyloside xylohydrolase